MSYKHIPAPGRTIPVDQGVEASSIAAAPRRAHRAALLTSILMATACAESIPVEPVEEPLIVHPADGAMAVRPGFEILVTHPVDQGPQLVEIHGELSDWTLACSIDATSTATSCESPRSLQEASDYELVLEFANGDTSWSEFSTRIPSSGKAFDLGYNASLTALGRDDSAAQILDSLITSWDLVVVQTAEPSLSDALLMGPATLTEEGTYRIGNPGLTTVLALREGGGEMLQTLPTDVLLPIPALNETIALPIRNLAFQGSPEQDGLQYTLTGFLEPAAMDLLSEAFGDTTNLLSMLVVLDHDLDGDGVLDAASLELVGWSPSVTLGAWSNE